jgi:primosomal protein N' (replication factor Y) (superfamily II helicase)
MPHLYCEVALPVPLHRTFTFSVPPELQEGPLVGSRLIVPFRRRPMVGVALSITDVAPQMEGIQPITKILDAIPALPPRLIELGRWLASYYLAPVGDCFRAMLPPADIRTDREYTISEAGREHLIELSSTIEKGFSDDGASREFTLLQFLDSQGAPVSASRLSKNSGSELFLERLIRRGHATVQTVTKQRHARTQRILAWNLDAEPGEDSREEKIRELLVATRGPLPQRVLARLSGVSASVLSRLDREGKLTSWEEPAVRDDDPWDSGFVPPTNLLNAEQQEAIASIRASLDARSFSTSLLHGVTGSGKTEVYLAVIEAALSQGRGALMLVPEIALTLWLSRLVRARFGGVVAVLHSALGDTERAREWWRARNGEARVMIGTRSAVFAPLENVGLIIVDEEQEASYKQEESPRYHGRDTAVMRAKIEGAVALLGSATPSLESYHHAQTGKYRLLELRSRVANRPLAVVRIVDQRQEFQQSGRATPVSRHLLQAIGQRLADGTQTLVLINRRGYSWFQLCRSCGASASCENCSISLTYHKYRDRLDCHYCGYSRRVPKVCPKCQSEHLYFVGDGAERVEEYLRSQFPNARTARLDRDSVRTKAQFQQVLGAFAAGELDLLVGTQMLAKGHDFERVTLVGVVSADLMLGRPDFRAAERTFQLLTQVAGRAGRGNLPGDVLVETYHPDHYAIAEAARQHYLSFFEREMNFRRLLHYPPFVALAAVLVRDRKIENAARWSRALAEYFLPHESQGLKVLGPAAAPLAMLKKEYRFQFLLKAPRRSALTRVLSGVLAFCAARKIPDAAVILDVDPLNLA